MLARGRFTNMKDMVRFTWAVIVIAIGAVILAEIVLRMIIGATLLFTGTERWFELAVGFITVVLGATLIPPPGEPARPVLGTAPGGHARSRSSF